MAGGAALHFEPNSVRFSNDLDYFHDSIEDVAAAFGKDEELLCKNKYKIQIEIKQPGYIRAKVANKEGASKVEWAHDTSWRFMPVVKKKDLGFVLHPIDLAVNKVLALAGRNEARDFLDVIDIHSKTLSLGALCWAAAGKDPGFTPASLLELLKRKGRFHADDFKRLKLNQEINLVTLKQIWLDALEEASQFIQSRPADEIGCLYYSTTKKKFFSPEKNMPQKEFVLHFGRPGGILPKVS
ncbi:MAG: hypothetical protein H7A33_05250 [Deltaproteobacteria bacterium]|nr:hypothetical protein [Deltaproteobacteria bacterium]